VAGIFGSNFASADFVAAGRVSACDSATIETSKTAHKRCTVQRVMIGPPWMFLSAEGWRQKKSGNVGGAGQGILIIAADRYPRMGCDSKGLAFSLHTSGNQKIFSSGNEVGEKRCFHREWRDFLSSFLSSSFPGVFTISSSANSKRVEKSRGFMCSNVQRGTQENKLLLCFSFLRGLTPAEFLQIQLRQANARIAIMRNGKIPSGRPWVVEGDGVKGVDDEVRWRTKVRPRGLA
jgi:hypothetical protein